LQQRQSEGSEPVARSAVRSSALLLCLAASAGPSAAPATEPLPSFQVDLAQSSVSGLSSGAYMAGQFHVAFSTTLIGVGLVAGGPYGCAEGQLAGALNRCMQTSLGAPDPTRLHELAENLATQGRIDPLTGLAGDRVYVFSGSKDETVTPPVIARAVEFYRLAGVRTVTSSTSTTSPPAMRSSRRTRATPAGSRRARSSTTATTIRRARSCSTSTAR
jgi:poly(3-hydroxybutyrate) depolymerase